MTDNKNFILASISIIIIIIIITLVFYKHKNDTSLDTSPDTFLDTSPDTSLDTSKNIIENFDITQDQQTIINNNNIINNLLAKLNNVSSISVNADTNAINKKFTTNIIDSINSNVALISSYSNNKSINVNNSISNIEKNIIDLENIVNNMNLNKVKGKEYSRVKSLNNGMEMEIVNTPNTKFTDLKTGLNNNAYLLMMNKGCLSVGANDYDVYKCNDNNPKQYFKMHHILNETDYNKNIDLSLPSAKTDLSKVDYPFAMIKSVNNDNCLTNNHGEITVQPCYSFVAQRWMPL